MNKFFATVGEKLAAKIPVVNQPSPLPPVQGWRDLLIGSSTYSAAALES